MKIRKPLLLTVAALVFAACGQQHRAKGIARSFIEEHQVEGDRFNMSFSKLDSTKKINDSAVVAMRKHVNTLPQFRPGITFESGAIPRTLLYMTARYTILTPMGDTLRCDNTFYMDQELKRIIAVK